METKPPNGSTDRQVGFLAGRIDGLTTAINALSGRFDEHLKEHRATWLWIIPTLFSGAVLVLLLVQTFVR